MKDGSKTISQRATRFLPVDMKDRLKSAFNRSNSAGPAASENDPYDDGEFAIFAPDRPAQDNLNPLRSPDNPVHQVATDIEEAEIVAESDAEPIDSTRSEIGEERSSFEVQPRAALKPAILRNASRPDVEAQSDISKRGESVSQKSRSRFFGDFASTESVRLKLEKRNEKRPELVSTARVAEPQSENSTTATNGAGSAPGTRSVLSLKSVSSDFINGDNRKAEGLGEPAASEQAHINLLKEYDSMEADEHESGNGAAVEGNSEVVFAIDRNSKFSGQLRFSGAITIEGQVEGELIARKIVVHEGGIVNASINGNTVIVAGTVKGDVSASDELEILPSGVVDGSVTSPAIIVRRGARVEGLIAIGVPRA